MLFVQIALKSLLEPSKVPALGSYSNCPMPPASATAEVTAVVPKYPFPKLKSETVQPVADHTPAVAAYTPSSVDAGAVIEIPVPEFCTVPFFAKYNLFAVRSK